MGAMKSKKRIGRPPRHVVAAGVRLPETPEDLARAIFRDAAQADEQGDNSSPSGALLLAGLFQQLRIPETLIPIYRDAAIYE